MKCNTCGYPILSDSRNQRSVVVCKCPDDQAQKPECPFCGDKRGIEHPSPCVCYKPDAQPRDTRLDIPDFVPTYTLTLSTSEYKIVVEKCDYDELFARCNFMIDSAQQNARERDALARKVAELETALAGRTYSHSDEVVELELATAQARIAELESNIPAHHLDLIWKLKDSQQQLIKELAAAKAEIESLRESLVLAKKQRDQFNQRVRELETALDWQHELNENALEAYRKDEQRLVSFAEHAKMFSQCMATREMADQALKAHKGGA